MNIQYEKFVTCLFCASLTACSQADSTVDVRVGHITQSTSGSAIQSEINLGSSVSERTDGLQLSVNVGGVTSRSTGGGHRSSINIGSAVGENTSGFKSRVVIGGKVVLITNGSDGEINIGSELSD